VAGGQVSPETATGWQKAAVPRQCVCGDYVAERAVRNRCGNWDARSAQVSKRPRDFLYTGRRAIKRGPGTITYRFPKSAGFTSNEGEFPASLRKAVITIREDEYDAVLRRLPRGEVTKRKHRSYVIAKVASQDGTPYRVALLRAVEQGPNAGQDAARDIIEDLDPTLTFVGSGCSARGAWVAATRRTSRFRAAILISLIACCLESCDLSSKPSAAFSCGSPNGRLRKRLVVTSRERKSSFSHIASSFQTSHRSSEEVTPVCESRKVST
jgi:hypothetical protein